MVRIISLNVSETVGNKKQPVDVVSLEPKHGIIGDAHARDWHRQVSLLAMESINKMSDKLPNLVPGSFAENITTEGIILKDLPIGTRLISGTVELEITQIGKKCHSKCNIYKEAGGCIMPDEGVFAKVITGGQLSTGAELVVQ
ncbi:MAG: MOSC domain-containing protein [Desulfobulbaceae bacterium]|jgi:MOSC domain-containing protein YiiM|nr:MOSC domain-containing protein [Desulfobulbaceae bacterium]